MALISCPECKAPVSEQASNCPHCGFPIKEVTAATQVLHGPSSREETNGKRSTNVRSSGGHVLAWIFAVIIAIPAVLAAGFYMRNKAVGPVGWAHDDTVKALKDKMKDPGSMVIRSSFVVQKTDEKGDRFIYTCGIVDGKNSYGGYIGGTRFASKAMYSKSLDTFFGTRTVQMEDPEQERTAKKVGMLSGFDKVYWNEWCVDAEHPAVVASKSG